MHPPRSKVDTPNAAVLLHDADRAGAFLADLLAALVTYALGRVPQEKDLLNELAASP